MLVSMRQNKVFQEMKEIFSLGLHPEVRQDRVREKMRELMITVSSNEMMVYNNGYGIHKRTDDFGQTTAGVYFPTGHGVHIGIFNKGVSGTMSITAPNEKDSEPYFILNKETAFEAVKTIRKLDFLTRTEKEHLLDVICEF